jgi:hypothetical protein
VTTSLDRGHAEHEIIIDTFGSTVRVTSPTISDFCQ